jgi:CelD/BcsL family acetyltransferase involved in cellulose biosynthesis
MKPFASSCPGPLWESLLRDDASATFFQTPVWLDIAARHFGAAPAPLLFDFSTGPACLPLLRDRRWGRSRFFSPFGTYTALLSPRKLDGREIEVVEADLRKRNLQFSASPFAENSVRAGRRLPAHTQVIDLTPAHADAPDRDWENDPRRRLRIAGESGVSVRAGVTAGDWEAYYGLYLKSLERWGAGATSAYPRALFESIRAAAASIDSAGARGPAVRLWLAEHQGRAAAGYIAFYHNRHACIWHGAADREYFKMGASQLLYREMIADAAGRGFAVFDLMGSAGLTALEAFKASLGARTVGVDTCLNRTGFVGALAGARDLWLRGV